MTSTAEGRKKRLDDLIKRRDAAKDVLQRTQGRLDSARADVKSIEDECRSKGVDPSKLASTIDQLETRYDQAVSDLESKIAQIEQQIAPFLGDT
jgi:predicted nuclease with TOPRIM domain